MHFSIVISDGIQGVRTGSREPVLAMPGYSANPFLLFVIDLLIHAAILSEPVLACCYSSYNLFELVAYPRPIEKRTGVLCMGSEKLKQYAEIGTPSVSVFMFLVLDLIFFFLFFSL